MVGKWNIRYAQLRVAITKLEVAVEEFVLGTGQRDINVRLKGVQMMPRVMDEFVEDMGQRRSTRRNALQRDAKAMLKKEGFVISMEQDIIVRYVLMKDAEILHSKEEFVEGTELFVNDVFTTVVWLSCAKHGKAYGLI